MSIRVVVIPPELWDMGRTALRQQGLEVSAVAAGPGQAPRYTLIRSGVTEAVRSYPSTLTARELQVLVGMANGQSNAAIGRSLEVSEDTVKTHARRIFRKLGVRDRAHAVAVGYQTDLLGGASS